MRYFSNGALKVSIKALYDYRCQICGSVIYKKGWHPELTRKAGWAFLNADVHHILPLSQKGPDVRSNMLFVCPSCHRKFHCGEYELEERNHELFCYDIILDRKEEVRQLHEIVLYAR